jgi:hypothetical protein
VELDGGGLQYATLTLDRTETYAHFADAQGDTFRAVLSPISSTELQGSGSTLLTFESTRIDTAVDDGSYQVKLHLEGQENGNHHQTDITSGADQITVEEAPRLSITSIINPASVTATLQPTWEIRMVLHNSGEASLDLDLSEDKTYLNFSIPPTGDVTGQYGIISPASLVISGGSILAGNQVDTLIFTVQNTGSTTGTALINGYVTASDVNSGDVLTDDTFSGGGGYVSVQNPGEIEITETVLSQPAVTSGQTSPWQARITVINTGEASVTLLPDSTYIYSDYDLEVPSPPSDFEGGGTVLAQGESGRLNFSVTPTPEVLTGDGLDIYSRVGMVENNSSNYIYFDSRRIF